MELWINRGVRGRVLNLVKDKCKKSNKHMYRNAGRQEMSSTLKIYQFFVL
jgi:hypothetical protein